MAQVFVSYKSEERERLRALVQALEGVGVSVWWDAQIQGGSAWRERIQHELEAAALVLVVWSEGSVGAGGRFVRDEASWALERGTYVPVLIDNLRLPIGFGEVQAHSLVGWKGEPTDARLQALLSVVMQRLAADREAVPAPALPHTKPQAQFGRRAFFTAAGLLLASGAAGALYWKYRVRSSERQAEGIAVLPFTDMSQKKDQAYFSDGLAEELRDALRRIATLRVIGRASCETVKDLPANEVSSKLGVGHVLTGSVRVSSSHLRVSTQLLQGSTGSEVWSQTFDRPPGDAIEIQAEVAERIAQALSIRLAPREIAALSLGGTDSSEAHDLILRADALFVSDSTEEASRQVLDMTDRALVLDANYFEAHLLKGRVFEALAGNARSASEAVLLSQKAGAEARRAISIAPELPRGYALLGLILSGDLDLRAAMIQFEHALSLSKDDVDALTTYSRFIGGIGRKQLSLKLATQAVTLNPLDSKVHRNNGLVLFFASRYPEAIQSYRLALSIAPGVLDVNASLGDCLLLTGQVDSARAAYAAAGKGNIFAITGEGIIAARSHDRKASDATISKIHSLYEDAASAQEAEIYAQLGDRDAAFTALERAWNIKDPGLSQAPADPWLEPLQADPRFRSFLQKLNVPT